MLSTDPPGASKTYFPFIDGLRALAVLGVICFHFNLAHIGGGYVGVDVFFVLSGYLISNLIEVRLRRQSFSFANFYERRARRILPALLLTCTLCAIAAVLLLVPHDLREFGKSLKAAAFFYSNVVFERSSGYFADPLSTRPLLHTWSLAVEEQFYLLFPPLLYAMHWMTRRSRPLLWSAMTLLFAVCLAVSILMVRADAQSAFYLLPARAWELLAGALIALAPWQVRISRAAAEIIAVLGVVFIGSSFAIYDRNTPFPGIAALLPCVGTMLIVIPNMNGVTAVGRILSNRLLVYLGLISYGLYLYHWPILAFSRYFLDHELTLTETCVALAATLGLAIASYHCIEAPVRTGKLLQSRKRVFEVSAAGILAIGVLGIATVNGNGFPQRFSGAALQYAADAEGKTNWGKCMPALDQLQESSLCRFGNLGSKPTFLVWGDSHAAALAPGVEARANTLGISGWVIAYNRCPALIGAAPIQHNRDDYPCRQIAERVLKLILDNHIKHVLLASRWDTYISGWERGGSETLQDLTISFTDEDGRAHSGADAFGLAVAGTIRRLRAMDVDIWVLEQVPPQLIDVPSALAKAVYLKRNPDLLRRPYEDIEQRREPADTVFEDLRELRGISLIDPAEKFCPGHSPCLIAAEGHALYSDGNHLSYFGSVWSQRMLDPFFSSIVR